MSTLRPMTRTFHAAEDCGLVPAQMQRAAGFARSERVPGLPQSGTSLDRIDRRGCLPPRHASSNPAGHVGPFRASGLQQRTRATASSATRLAHTRQRYGLPASVPGSSWMPGPPSKTPWWISASLAARSWSGPAWVTSSPAASASRWSGMCRQPPAPGSCSRSASPVAGLAVRVAAARRRRATRTAAHRGPGPPPATGSRTGPSCNSAAGGVSGDADVLSARGRRGPRRESWRRAAAGRAS
jgi:hypothetical protein